MFIGAYWSEREESKEAAARRISQYLVAIGKQFDDFATWYNLGNSRAEALRSPVSVNAESIASNLSVNRRDSDRQPIPELGFQFSAWNGKNVSFSADIGSYSQYVINSVVLDSDALELKMSRTLLDEIIRAFDPEHAVFASDEHLAQTGAEKPWHTGWLTYERGETVRQHKLP